MHPCNCQKEEMDSLLHQVPLITVNLAIKEPLSLNITNCMIDQHHFKDTKKKMKRKRDKNKPKGNRRKWLINTRAEINETEDRQKK